MVVAHFQQYHWRLCLLVVTAVVADIVGDDCGGDAAASGGATLSAGGLPHQLIVDFDAHCHRCDDSGKRVRRCILR